MKTLSEKMLCDLCRWLAGQDGQLQKEAIPILHLHYGYTPEDFETLNICSADEASEYIEEYKLCNE